MMRAGLSRWIVTVRLFTMGPLSVGAFFSILTGSSVADAGVPIWKFIDRATAAARMDATRPIATAIAERFVIPSS